MRTTLVLMMTLLPALASARTVDGSWQGPLSVGAIRLRLLAKIKGDTATVDSIDQGAKDIPVQKVTWKDPDLTLELPRIASVFEGKLSADGSEIVGHWKQSGATLPLTLKRVDQVTEPRRPQEPKPPFPYQASEVGIDNKPAHAVLAGTLTRPPGAGPFPAVVLITGSGAQDRDESLMGHKPFWVIADALTRRGIAVLRVDDRGFAKSTGDLKKATTADFVTDALACVTFLRDQPTIDKNRIGLVGHSEGGVIAAMAAATSKDVAFAVLLAGSALPGEDIIYMQQEAIMRAGGAGEDQINRALAHQKQLFAVIKAEHDNSVAERKLRELLAAHPGAEQAIPGLLSPWYRAFLVLDPRPYLRKVTVPVLALNGERDLQVPPKQNLGAIAESLKQAKNADFTTRELPGLNHLFQTSKTGLPTEYAAIDETFNPAALQILGDWIVAHARRP